MKKPIVITGTVSDSFDDVDADGVTIENVDRSGSIILEWNHHGFRPGDKVRVTIEKIEENFYGCHS